MRRLFVATKVEFGHDFKELITNLKYACRNDKIVWVEPENIHLTLRFLGPTSTPQLSGLNKALKEVTGEMTSFILDINKMGVFGSHYAPLSVWLGFKDFELFKQLFEKLEEKIEPLGFEPPYGNFVPHITLGRIKAIDNKQRFWEYIEQSQPHFSQKLRIHTLTLYQSRLMKRGPVYKSLGEFPLLPEN